MGGGLYLCQGPWDLSDSYVRSSCTGARPLALELPEIRTRLRRVPHSNYAIPRRLCICSNETPRVSGNQNSTTKNCSTAMDAKNTNGAAWDEAARIGNSWDTIAFMNQWEKLPRLWPFARTRLGKISLR